MNYAPVYMYMCVFMCTHERAISSAFLVNVCLPPGPQSEGFYQQVKRRVCTSAGEHQPDSGFRLLLHVSTPFEEPQ